MKQRYLGAIAGVTVAFGGLLWLRYYMRKEPKTSLSLEVVKYPPSFLKLAASDNDISIPLFSDMHTFVKSNQRKGKLRVQDNNTDNKEYREIILTRFWPKYTCASGFSLWQQTQNACKKGLNPTRYPQLGCCVPSTGLCPHILRFIPYTIHDNQYHEHLLIHVRGVFSPSEAAELDASTIDPSAKETKGMHSDGTSVR